MGYAHGVRWPTFVRDSISSRLGGFVLLCLILTTPDRASGNEPDALPDWVRPGLQAALTEKAPATRVAALEWIATTVNPRRYDRRIEKPVFRHRDLLAFVKAAASQLSHDDPKVLAAAADALYELGNLAGPHALEIAMLLTHDDENVRRNATKAFLHLNHAAARHVPALIERLADTNRDVREAAIETLEKLGPIVAPYLQNIADLLNHDDKDIVHAALDTLDRLDRHALPLMQNIAHFLTDSDDDIRAMATRILGGLGQKAANSYLKTVTVNLADRESAVRSAAVYTIGEWGQANTRHTEPLVDLLLDRD